VCLQRTERLLPYCLQLPPLPRRCLAFHEDDSELAVDAAEQRDYQEILDRPSSARARRQCASIVAEFRTQLNCRRDVYENMTLRQPSSMDECRCYPPCSDVMYDARYSLSTLPPITREHATFYSHLDRFLQSTLSPDRKRLLGVKDSMQTVHNSLYKPKFHLLRHFTTRHNALSVAHAFWYRKKSYVLCRRCCAARSAQHVATSATDVIRNSVCSVVCIKLRSP